MQDLIGSNKNMQALILAAGMGKRLGTLTKEDTKCMVEVNGAKLIDKAIISLVEAGIKDICIVIGYQGNNLKDYVLKNWTNLNFTFIENKDYDKTNNIYSLFLAKDFLCNDDTILLESDLIFDKEIIQELVIDPRPNLAVIDNYKDWMDGTVVSTEEDSYISSFISKNDQSGINMSEYYKTVNIYKFSKHFSSMTYMPFLEAYCNTVGKNEYYEEVLSLISNLPKKELYGFKVNNYKWYEIDDINDYRNATTMFSDDSSIYSEYSSRYGGYWKFPKLIDYCYLVNPYFPSKKFKKELSANFDIALSEYPSGQKTIEQLAANVFNVDPNFIVVGNGVSEIIPILASEMKDLKVGLFYPSFDEYESRFNVFLKINSFNMTTEDIEYYIKDMSKVCDVIILVNPENPTGKFVPVKNIKSIARELDKENCKLIVDESFIDFAGEDHDESLVNNKTLTDNSNLIVLKSIGKSFGVPGIRLGILASSDTELLGKIRSHIPIWNINSFAEFFLQKVSKYQKDFRTSCLDLVSLREDLSICLANIGIHVFPSSANFLMIKLPDIYNIDHFLTFAIKHNFLIKSLSKKNGMPNGNYLRIAVKTKEENDALVSLFNKYMVLFKNG